MVLRVGSGIYEFFVFKGSLGGPSPDAEGSPSAALSLPFTLPDICEVAWEVADELETSLAGAAVTCLRTTWPERVSSIAGLREPIDRITPIWTVLVVALGAGRGSSRRSDDAANKEDLGPAAALLRVLEGLASPSDPFRSSCEVDVLKGRFVASTD
jgi:hypothetical protein